MKLVTFGVPGGGRQLGLWEGPHVYSLSAVDKKAFASLERMLAAAHAAGQTPLAYCSAAAPAARQGEALAFESVHLLKPLEPVEVWAAGVTYERSRAAREAESGGSNLYDRVYRAERPEIFFKATAARCVGPGEAVGLRSDSNWQVPEAELGLVIGYGGRLIGITAGNDQSSRDIEGENALYLPQAKIFRRACAIGPAVRLVDSAPGPLSIRLTVWRQCEPIFSGETSTARMVRSADELIEYLLRDNDFFPPTVLLTGTGIVPPDDFTLLPGDLVEIEVESVGVLKNRVG